MFTYHDKDSAPAESAALVEKSIEAFGTIPNMHKILAEAPAAYEAYLATYGLLTKSSLSPLEQQVVMMAANYENRCQYCTAGHTMMMKVAKMPDDVIEALRNGTPIADTKLEALRVYVRELLEHRGHIGDARLAAFLDAGYTKRQALEVLVGLAAKVLTNFTNALAHIELDDVIKPYAWTPPGDATSAAQ